jgi:hypothetical protein
MALSDKLKNRIRVSITNKADADALIAAIESGSNPQGAAVADVSTANGSDPATTQALANANKAKINELLASLRAAGIIAP